MKITIGQRTKYYAKRGKHGRLYNPIGMFSEGMASRKLGHAGRFEWRFTEVSEKVFAFYRDFLKTKSVSGIFKPCIIKSTLSLFLIECDGFGSVI